MAGYLSSYNDTNRAAQAEFMRLVEEDSRRRRDEFDEESRKRRDGLDDESRKRRDELDAQTDRRSRRTTRNLWMARGAAFSDRSGTTQRQRCESEEMSPGFSRRKTCSRNKRKTYEYLLRNPL